MTQETQIAILQSIREDVRKFRQEFFEQMDTIRKDINKFKADVKKEVLTIRDNGVK